VDNVWEIDCSSLIDAKYDGPLGVPRVAVHGSYFDDPDTMALIRDLLRGTDRTVLEHTRRTSGNKWP
jgi:hypothetical protein